MDNFNESQGSFLETVYSQYKTPNTDAIRKTWVDLFKLNTELGASYENFDIISAKAYIAEGKITGASAEVLQTMIDDYAAYQSYLDEIDSYLSGIFGQLGSEMMDSLSQNSNMAAWADDVTGYISDSFSKMVKDIIYDMDFASLLTTEQDKIKDILADTTTNDAQKEQAMQDELTTFRAQLIAAGTQAATDWNTFNVAWMASGGNDLAGSTTTANSTTSAIKSMDQPTADILTAQFSAMRIHTSNMDTTLSRYLPELSLSLQSQAGILQLAFADVSQIRQNTNRIPEMVDILKDLKTYGIKVL